MSKRFDDRFELESQGCSECGGYELIDKTEKRYPKGKYYCEQDLEKIKSFIQSEIDIAVKATEQRILEKWDSYVDATVASKQFNRHWLKAHMRNFISLITNK